MSEVMKLTIKKIVHDKRVMIPLFMLIVVGATLAVTTYTWFFKGGALLEIEFQTGYVEMNIGIFEGKDFDHDGVLDTDPAESAYTPVYVPLEINGGRANPITVSGIQGTVEELKLPDIEMQNLAPGQIYTYKFEVISLGDIDSLFDLQLTEYNGANPADIKKYIDVKVFENDALITEQNLESWDPTAGPLSLTGGTGATTSSEQATDVIVQFCFKETGNMVESSYEGGSFSLPNMRIRIYSAD
ncbi:MAG: hypothetical protein J5622_03990 [Firmicutes bacterium]|nr:hypothetical protein [Bacillota bacterium]